VKKNEMSSVGFLLVQVGAHAGLAFAEHLAPTGLTPALAGVLGALATAEGSSQQALASRLGSHPSRMVAIVDDLEERGLIERRQNRADRRTHALHLTDEGRERVRAIQRIAREYQATLCAALSEREREQLAELLRRIADQQGLVPGVHPGFRSGR
jgi:DNA-binding MarR family transcriptional regulator